MKLVNFVKFALIGLVTVKHVQLKINHLISEELLLMLVYSITVLPVNMDFSYRLEPLIFVLDVIVIVKIVGIMLEP